MKTKKRIGCTAAIFWAACLFSHAELIGHWTFETGDELTDLTGNFPDLSLEGDATVADGALDVNGTGTNASGWAYTTGGDGYTGPEITNKTLVSWVSVESPSTVTVAGSAMTIDRVASDQFDGIIFAERDANTWMNGSNGFSRTPPGQFVDGLETNTDGSAIVKMAISYEDLGGGRVEITGYRNGMEIGQYEDEPLGTWLPGDTEVIFGKRHGNPAPTGPGALDALIHEARLYDTALSAAEVDALTLTLSVDSDGDGLDDVWEQSVIDSDPDDAIESLTDINPEDDLDGDGLTNEQESKSPRTNPLKADSDGDNLNDNVETQTGVFVDANDTGTNPNRPDSDDDGLQDDVETGTGVFVSASDTGTDPNNADTDGDRLSDGDEVADPFTDPHDPDDPAPPPLEDTLLGRWTFDAGEELIDLVGNFPDLSLEGDAEIVDGQLDVNGAGTTATGWAYTTGGDYAGPEIGDKTLVSWVTLESLEGGATAGSVITIDRLSGDVFDGIIFSERQANRWMNGSSGFTRTMDFTPGFEETSTGEQIMMAITYEGLGGGQLRVTGYRNGEEIGTYEDDAFATWPTGDAEIIFGKRHGNPAPTGPGALDALIDEARIYGQAATASQIMDLFNAGPGGGGGKFPLGVERVGDELVFTWASAGGKLYNLRSELDPASAGPADWPIYMGNEDVQATPPQNTITVPMPADPFRLFVIEEFNAPPVAIFSDDFESGAGAWVTGSVGAAGTEWELGTPANVGPPAAHGGSNVFATNVDANYGDDADVFLRSPAIDLGTAGGATLRMYHYVDIEVSFDAGEIAILDATDDSELAVLESPVEGFSGDWEEFTKSLPAEALGKSIKLEFRFTSDDFNNPPQAGWYIDDVAVTVP